MSKRGLLFALAASGLVLASTRGVVVAQNRGSTQAGKGGGTGKAANQELYFEGRIFKVDAPGRMLVLTHVRSSTAADTTGSAGGTGRRGTTTGQSHTVMLARDAKITVNGHKATQADLRARMRARVWVRPQTTGSTGEKSGGMTAYRVEARSLLAGNKSGEDGKK